MAGTSGVATTSQEPLCLTRLVRALWPYLRHTSLCLVPVFFNNCNREVLSGDVFLMRAVRVQHHHRLTFSLFARTVCVGPT